MTARAVNKKPRLLTDRLVRVWTARDARAVFQFARLPVADRVALCRLIAVFSSMRHTPARKPLRGAR